MNEIIKAYCLRCPDCGDILECIDNKEPSVKYYRLYTTEADAEDELDRFQAETGLDSEVVPVQIAL